MLRFQSHLLALWIICISTLDAASPPDVISVSSVSVQPPIKIASYRTDTSAPLFSNINAEEFDCGADKIKFCCTNYVNGRNFEGSFWCRQCK